MPGRLHKQRPTAHELAAEIIWRGNQLNDSGSHVIVLSDPPTAQERLRLVAANLQGICMMVTTPAMTEDEWERQYCRHDDAPPEPA